MNTESDLFTTYLRRSVVALTVSLTSLAVCPAVSYAEEVGLDTARIGQLTGLKGSYDAKEAVFTVRYPRDDLDVNAGGIHITAPFGLTAWAAFTRAGPHVTVMGDMVMLEDQVNPVMSVALDSGLRVTALHNHYFLETPRLLLIPIARLAASDEDESQSVLKTLRGNRINILSIPNHMTGELLRIVFLQYWGVGTTRDLATGVKAAFDLVRD